MASQRARDVLRAHFPQTSTGASTQSSGSPGRPAVEASKRLLQPTSRLARSACISRPRGGRLEEVDIVRWCGRAFRACTTPHARGFPAPVRGRKLPLPRCGVVRSWPNLLQTSAEFDQSGRNSTNLGPNTNSHPNDRRPWKARSRALLLVLIQMQPRIARRNERKTARWPRAGPANRLGTCQTCIFASIGDGCTNFPQLQARSARFGRKLRATCSARRGPDIDPEAGAFRTGHRAAPDLTTPLWRPS